MNLAELGARISQALDTLSPQNQKAAAYLMQHPEDVALLSMRDVARKAGVPPSTLVRLTQALGYSSYADIKQHFVASLKEGSLTPFSTRARDLQVRSEGGGDQKAAILSEQANILAAILAMNGEEYVHSFAVDLLKVDNLYIYGTRSAFAPMYQYYYLYQMFRRNGIIVSNPSGNQIDIMRRIQSGDGLLMVSFDPYAREAVAAAEMARRAGASVFAITDNLVSPIAACATSILTVPVAISSFFPSLVGVNALLEVIVATQVVVSGKAALKELTLTEERLAEMAAYWKGGR